MSAPTSGWDRREFLGGAALFALALGIPAAAVRWTDLAAEDLPSDRQRRMIGFVSDLVIPRSETPGAADVAVGEFVVLALAHHIDGTGAPMDAAAITPAFQPYLRRNGSLRHLAWLEGTLDQAAGGDFLRHSRERCAQWLTALDAEAFADGARFSPWKAIKSLILDGYYTSEAGASQELRYELVPGKWEWDLAITPDMRAFSSDWTAVDFG